MMIFVVLIGFLAVGYLLAYPIRRAERGIKSSEAVWNRIQKNLDKVASDDSYPLSIAATLTLLALVAGCGCFTRAMVMDLFRNAFGFSQPKSPPLLEAFDEAIDALRPDQMRVVAELVEQIALYDTYRSFLMGPVVRYLMIQASAERKIAVTISEKPASSEHIQQFVHAAQPVVERESRHRPMPKNLTMALAS